MFLIFGLGNPDAKYQLTRHNIGFMAADVIMSRYNFSTSRLRFHAEYSEGIIDNHKVIILKPLTYMNRSGICAAEIVNFYKVPLEKIIVLHDDLDLSLGHIKLKIGGSHGGHNGLKSLDAHIGKDYWRVRIGIGHPGDKSLVTPYVLGNFTKQEIEIVEQKNMDIAANIAYILNNDIETFRTNIVKDF
jgi:PTH1 family peptidyl-tRNA hydrolase